MLIDEKLLGLKRSIEELTQRRDKVAWQHEEITKSMQEEFGFSTVGAADKELKRLGSQADKLEKEIEKGLAQIHKNHQSLLEVV